MKLKTSIASIVAITTVTIGLLVSSPAHAQQYSNGYYAPNVQVQQQAQVNSYAYQCPAGSYLVCPYYCPVGQTNCQCVCQGTQQSPYQPYKLSNNTTNNYAYDQYINNWWHNVWNQPVPPPQPNYQLTNNTTNHYAYQQYINNWWYSLWNN